MNSICEAEIIGQPVKLGKDKEMQTPCKLKLTGRSKFANISEKS